MFTLFLIALQISVVGSSSIPPAPPPPPPFTKEVAAVERPIAARVNDEFKRCGDARTNSNGRYVDAFGTPRHSTAWKKAAAAMDSALTICRGLRRALRDQKDFLVSIVQSGTPHDAPLAANQLNSVSSELAASERYFETETKRYRDLNTVGWGNPHCAERPDGFMPPTSICPNGATSSL